MPTERGEERRGEERTYVAYGSLNFAVG